MKHTTICLVAGKSGGHIQPCLNLRAQYNCPSHMQTYIFIASSSPLDRQILNDTPGIDHTYFLNLPNLPAKKIVAWIGFSWLFMCATIKSLFILIQHRPAKIISTGSIVAVPVCLVAKLLCIPICLYELNVVPGNAVRLIAPLADIIHICFAQSKKYLNSNLCRISPYPLKRSSHQLPDTMPHAVLAQIRKKMTIFIFGGSQGSMYINSLWLGWIKKNALLIRQYTIIHQTGHSDERNWKDIYQMHQIEHTVFKFNSVIEPYYFKADLIICRAGAGTLFELAHFNKKAVVIPLETAYTNHQLHNALAMQSNYPDLITVIRQPDIQKNDILFGQTLRNIFEQMPCMT